MHVPTSGEMNRKTGEIVVEKREGTLADFMRVMRPIIRLG